MVTFNYDGLGRTLSRLDQVSGQSLTTTWTWDTAAHGKGKLAQLASPDGTKTYTYTGLGQLHTLTLAVNGESDTLQATLDYNGDGRQDLLMPLSAGTDVAPAWAILQAQEAGSNGPTFTLVDLSAVSDLHQQKAVYARRTAAMIAAAGSRLARALRGPGAP